MFQGLSLLPASPRTNSERAGSALQPSSATTASQPRGAQQGDASQLQAPCSSQGGYIHISRWKSLYILLTYSNYSWRENISHLTRLTKALTVLCKIVFILTRQFITRLEIRLQKGNILESFLATLACHVENPLACLRALTKRETCTAHSPECGSEPGPFLWVSFDDMPGSYIIPFLFSRQQTW